MTGRSRGCERQWIARPIRRAERQRKPPSPSSNTSTGSPPCTSTPPPQSSIWCRRFPERAARPGRAASCRAGASAVTHRGLMRRQTAARCGTRFPACGPAASRRWLVPRPGRTRPTVAPHLYPSAGEHGGERTDGVDRIRRAARGRSARPAGATQHSLWRRPNAISTPSANSQGAPSRTAAVPCARTSKPVASITSTQGP